LSLVTVTGKASPEARGEAASDPPSSDPPQAARTRRRGSSAADALRCRIPDVVRVREVDRGKWSLLRRRKRRPRAAERSMRDPYREGR
jgi:hypothetical protein